MKTTELENVKNTLSPLVTAICTMYAGAGYTMETSFSDATDGYCAPAWYITNEELDVCIMLAYADDDDKVFQWEIYFDASEGNGAFTTGQIMPYHFVQQEEFAGSIFKLEA